MSGHGQSGPKSSPNRPSPGRLHMPRLRQLAAIARPAGFNGLTAQELAESQEVSMSIDGRAGWNPRGGGVVL